MEKNTVYVLIRLTLTGENDLSLDPIGVYESLEEAVEWTERLDKINTQKQNTVFDVIDMEMGEKPIIMDFMDKAWIQHQDQKTVYIQQMMKRGWVDQLIGEDGNFYYKVTQNGEKAAEHSSKINQLFMAMFSQNNN